MWARREVGIVGVVMVVAGLVATLTIHRHSVFRAEAALQFAVSPQLFGPPEGMSDVLLEQLRRPDVSERVRERIGSLPPVRVSLADDGTALVHSRASTPWLASQAATTYATSWVEVRREETERARRAAAAEVQRRLDQLRGQIDQADDAQRPALVELRQALAVRMDQLSGDTGPIAEVVRSTPGTRSGAGLPTGALAGLGVLVLGAHGVSRARAGHHRALET